VTTAPALLLLWSLADGGAPDAGATPDAGQTPAPLIAEEPGQPAVALSGQLFARGSRDPVPGASLVVDGLLAADTDPEGRFALVVPPGRRVVQVQHPGFLPLTQLVLAAPGMPPLQLRLAAAEGAAQRYETVVHAEAGQEQGPKRTLAGPEITRTAGTLGDPFRVIESLPGVATMLWPLPVYAVRGSNPGNTGYFLDGVRIPAMFHFALGPAVIHPYFLESLDFYPGGYPARYGRYVAGLVSATTAAPPPDRLRGSVDVRLFDAGGLLSVPIDEGRGTVAVAARYALPAGLATALVEDVRFHYWDYQARVDHLFGPGRLSLTALGSFDLLATRSRELTLAPEGELTESREEQVLRLQFHRLDLRWRGAAAGGRLSAGLALGHDSTQVPFEGRGNVGARARSLSPRVGYQRALRLDLDLEAGLDAEIASYRGLLTQSIARQPLGGLAFSRNTVLVGSHGSLVYRPHERVVLSPGLRLDVFSEGGARAADLGPRLNLRVRALDALWLKASGARASQLPSLPLQLPGIEANALGRHGLQSAWQGSVGLEAAALGVELDASSFIQRSVLTDMRDPAFGDPLLDDFLIRRDALAYGLEVMLRRPPGSPLHGWLAYTLSRSLRAFEGGVVGPSDWDQRHVFNLVLGYRWGATTLGSRFHLHTGRMVPLRNVQPLEMARLPPFFQLDLRVDRRFVYDRWVLDAYLELVNATLSRQVVELQQTPQGRRDQGFRIALPSLGVRAEF
jgi:hypothetical protein